MRVTAKSVTMAALFSVTSGVVLAQGGPVVVSDAQVESNVIRQLATAPELSSQNIQTTTVYGVVTLTGSVQNDAMRSTAENLAARALGVKKVVDQLTLGDASANASQGQYDPAAANGNQASDAGPGPGMVLQSDGTYAPANAGQSGDASQQNAAQSQPSYSTQQQADGSGQPAYNNSGSSDQGYNQNANNQGYNNGGYNGQGYNNQPPPSGYGGDGRQPLYNGQPVPPPDGPYAGQQAGLAVTIPSGTPLQVRLNRGFNSNNVQVGTPFTATVMYDVVAGNSIAIPRGALVQGTVIEAKRAGAFGGKGQLGLQITGLSLGGQEYPLTTAVWDARGRDKTGRTVGSAVGLGILGALVGGAVGGGAGAAIGAGVGAGAGVAASGASQGGEIILPPETTIGFAVDQPTTVTTVGPREMARLAYAAGPPPQRRPEYRRRYYSPYYGYYYGPGM